MTRLSPRRRRALGLSAFALLVIATASFVYLRSVSTPQSGPTARATFPASVQRFGDVVSYDFVTPSIGWAVDGIVSQTSDAGPYTLLRTADGAKHWQKQLSGQTSRLFETTGSLQMLDTTDGFFVAGDPLHLYRTSDGGAHWAILKLPSADASRVVFSDFHHGWLLAQSNIAPSEGPHLYATGDAGSSWIRLPNPPADLLNITFRSPSEGWAGARGAENQPRVYASEDGGRSWRNHQLPSPPVYSGNLYSTFMELLPTVGTVAIMNYQDAYYQLTSFNGGSSWTYTTAPPAADPKRLPSYAYEDTFHWWAIAGSELSKTSDAGRSWTRTSSTIPEGLTLLRVFDSSRAWARFNYSLGSGLTFTADGGLDWTQAKVPIPLGG
jgi:photosystem II stability/assembly factor-like uncharacterized protein